MPGLLASATADAHLNLDPLDQDLQQAEAMCLAAFNRIEAAARIDVSLDISEAQAQMAQLETELRDRMVDIAVDLNENTLVEAQSQLDAFAAQVPSIRVNVDISDADLTRTLGELEALEELANLDATVDLHLNTVEAYAEFAAFIATIERTGLAVQVDIDPGGDGRRKFRDSVRDLFPNGVGFDIDPDLDDKVRERVNDLPDVDVDFGDESLAGFQTKVADLLGSLQFFNGEEFTLRVNDDRLGEAFSTVALLKRLIASGADFPIGVDGMAAFEAAFASVIALEEAVEDGITVDIDAAITGFLNAVGEITALRGSPVFDDITVGVDGDPSGFAKFVSSLSGQLDGFLLSVDSRVQERVTRRLRDSTENDLRNLIGNIGRTISEALSGFGRDGTTGVERIKTAFIGLRTTVDEVAESAESTLAGLSARMARLGRNKATFVVDIDGIAEAVVQTESLWAALRALPNRTRTRFETDGLSGALAEIAEFRLILASIPNRVRTVLDVDTGFMDRLRGFFGGRGQSGGTTLFTGLIAQAQKLFQGFADFAGETFAGVGQSLSQGLGNVFNSLQDGASTLGQWGGRISEIGKGISDLGDSIPFLDQITSGIGQLVGVLGTLTMIGGIVNLIGALVSAIAALVAWLIPLATGLVAAAGGLVALAAAATLATGALGAIAIAFDPAAIEYLKSQFATIKNLFATTFADALAPVKSLILDEFIPGLVGTLPGIVAALAPFATATLRPITDALLSILPLLETVGPIAQATGEGIGQLIDTFGRFAAAVNIGQVVDQVNSMFGALDATLQLLGESGLAFIPILTQMLDLFAGLARESIGPFTEIIATFGAALPAFASSIHAILEPLGQLAVVGGQAFAALAPQLDELFGLFQAIVPTLNFEVFGTVIQRVIPMIAESLERLGPVITQIGDNWVRFTQQMLTDSNLESMQRLFETLVVALLSFTEVLVAAAPAISAVFRVVLDMGRGVLASVAGIGAAVFGLGEIVWSVVDAIMEASAAPFKAIAAGLELLPDQFVPDGLIDGIRALANPVGDAADGFRDFSINARQSMVDLYQFASGSVDAAGDIKLLGGVTAGAGRSLDTFAVTVESSVGQLKLVGPAARQAASAMERIRQQFRVTATAVAGFRDELGDPGKLFKSAVDAANSDLQSAAGAAKDSIASNFGSNFGEFFTIPDETVNKVRDGAKAVADGVNEFLGFGKLSSFVEGSERSVIRSLDRLARSLEQKAVNIGRLKLLDQMGFTDLAVQLASMNDDPGALGKFLDQLFGAGIDTISAQNARLAGLKDRLVGGYAGLSPALSAALGQSFGEEAQQKVDKASTNINDALNNLVSDVRTKAENFRRLAALDNAGYGALAESLATMAGDPATLKSALDQLAAGGVAAYASANNRLKTAQDEVVAAAATMGPRLREAAGAGAPEAGEGVEETSANVFQALDKFRSELLTKMRSIQILFELERDEFGNLAVMFSGLDPTQIITFYDQLKASGDQAFAQTNTAIGEWISGSKAQLDVWDPVLAAALGVDPGSVTADALGKFADRVNGALDNLGLEDGSWKSITGHFMEDPVAAKAKELADATVKGIDEAFAEVEQQIQERGAAIGGSFIEVIVAEVVGKEVDASARISTSIERIFSGVSIPAYTVVGEVAATVGQTFRDAMEDDIANGSDQIGAAVNGLLNSVTASAAGRATTAGIVTGETFAAFFGVGFAVSIIEVTVSIGQLLDSLTVSITARLTVGGFAAGAGMAGGVGDGFTVGWTATSLRITTDLTAAASQLASSLAESYRNSGVFLGVAFGEGVGDGLALTLALVELQATLMALSIQATIQQALGINSPSTVGRQIGVFFGQGVAAGISDGSALVARQTTDMADQMAAGIGMVPLSPQIDVAALAAIVVPPLPVTLVPQFAPGFIDELRTASTQIETFPVPTATPVQQTLPAAPASTDASMLGVLTQILAAIQALDTDSDPLVLSLLQQILAGQNPPATMEDQAALASYAKALMAR